MNLINQAFSKLNREYFLSEEKLGIYRIYYCSIILFVVGLLNPWAFLSIPTELYEKIYGLTSLTDRLFSFFQDGDSFPSFFIWAIVSIVNLISFICMFIGYKTKASSLLYSLSVLFLKAYIEGYLPGAGRHIVYDLVPLFMAFSGWGNKFSVDERRVIKHTVYGFPAFFVIFSLCFAIFSAGIPKLSTGWLSLDDQAVYWHIVTKHLQRSSDLFFIGFLVDSGELWIWEVVDYIVVILELIFIFAFPWRKLILVLISLMVCFHLGVVLSMNISFFSISIPYMLVLIAYVDTKRIETRIRKLFDSNKLYFLFAIIPLIYLIEIAKVDFSRVTLLRGFLPGLVTDVTESGIGSFKFELSNYLGVVLWVSYLLLVLSIWFGKKGLLTKKINA